MEATLSAIKQGKHSNLPILQVWTPQWPWPIPIVDGSKEPHGPPNTQAIAAVAKIKTGLALRAGAGWPDLDVNVKSPFSPSRILSEDLLAALASRCLVHKCFRFTFGYLETSEIPGGSHRHRVPRAWPALGRCTDQHRSQSHHDPSSKHPAPVQVAQTESQCTGSLWPRGSPRKPGSHSRASKALQAGKAAGRGVGAGRVSNQETDAVLLTGVWEMQVRLCVQLGHSWCCVCLVPRGSRGDQRRTQHSVGKPTAPQPRAVWAVCLLNKHSSGRAPGERCG